MTKNSLPLCSFHPHHTRWSVDWWWNIGFYLTHGVWYDIAVFVHRGVYGWAPRDVSDLDVYLYHVYAETLRYMAEHSTTCPPGYSIGCTPKRAEKNHKAYCALPHDSDIRRRYTNKWRKAWKYDLRKWSRAFEDYSWWVEHGYDHLSHITDGDTRHRAFEAVCKWHATGRDHALRDLRPWMFSLWDPFVGIDESTGVNAGGDR